MKFKLFLIVLVAVLFSGCISMKSYVDPKYGDVSYDHVNKPDEPHSLAIETEFYRNHERFKKADGELKANVERVVKATGVIIPAVGEKQSGILRVKCNNIADLAKARAQGFGTGLTFGAAGSAISDYYEIEISLEVDGKKFEKKYEHAIHSTIGNKAPPVTGVAPTKPVEAFGLVLEDVLLEFIKEMQASGNLSTHFDQDINKA